MTGIQQHTIDIGIDLGTTNSAIAVVEAGQAMIIRNNQNRDYTPSNVRIGRGGGVEVGDAAYLRLGAGAGDVAAEFKRWIGDTEARFTFRSTGASMSGAELSAEVLKSLAGDVERRFGQSPRAAVITVPAAFDLRQCAATQRAAELAGLLQAPLLQEPVAASLAYGYELDASTGTWLVYDLGGGTFDLALVGIREGRIQVLDHDGDNFLGGKDFDWAVVERLIVPELARRYAVASFTRQSGARSRELGLLKTRAETAKIALSAVTETLVSIEPELQITDDQGREIDLDLTLTRAGFEDAIRPFVDRAAEVARALLARNPQHRAEAVLLVGGPTLTPLVRRSVAELGLRADVSIDPMTAVARGAALFAAAQPLEAAARGSNKAAGGSAAITLRHAAVTEDDETAVGCQVEGAAAVAVELRSSDGGWSSGRLPLRNGAAVTRVPLRLRGANVFTATAYDQQGSRLGEAEFLISRGLTAAAPPLARSLRVVLRDSGSGRSQAELLIERGTPLPTGQTFPFRTTLALVPGGELEVIGIYLVEGEALRPERNQVVGHVEITDQLVDRTVPAGSPVELRVEVDASRKPRAWAFLPTLDQTFELAIDMRSESPKPADLTRQLLKERERIDDTATTLTGEEVRRLNREAERTAGLIHTADGGEPGTGQQAEQALQALQLSLDSLDETTAWPRTRDEAMADREETQRVVARYGSESQGRRLEALSEDLDGATARQDIAETERTAAKITRLRFELLADQPWFWKDWFDYLAANVHSWTDVEAADRAVQMGTRAAMQNDIQSLRKATITLSDLAPRDQTSFANVGIRRG